jgi:hypothetical protein
MTITSLVQPIVNPCAKQQQRCSESKPNVTADRDGERSLEGRLSSRNRGNAPPLRGAPQPLP